MLRTPAARAQLMTRLLRTKRADALPPSGGPSKLPRCLDTLDLTSLGVGSCVGTGMYLVAGLVARQVAGPGVLLSFMVAALAALLSGACYAEFGARVPHTSGSAYAYTYVAVGEFTAFVIGWTLVLEYVIGAAACACALSASLDALWGGAARRASGAVFGSLAGRPPDLLAAGITLAVTALLAGGARKSLLFNHLLNALQLSVWAFVMAAGAFYVDTANWSMHHGFLPLGWGGVLNGGATCFYAFIGFDIIATTGGEALDPRRSIPRAIGLSLGTILFAYVTTSLMLTLMVPWDSLDADAALVGAFGQLRAPSCQLVVALGACAGLGVSLFGSLFPAPRVLLAMAQDGLLPAPLAALGPVTRAPLLATLVSGLAAASAALLLPLELLVEMMSIGTLLAYTLVAGCVLLLRYQPLGEDLTQLLPASLRTPLPSPGVTPMPPPAPTTLGVGTGVTVRRVTSRASPDSDDSCADGADADADSAGARDDQFLVSDAGSRTFYGAARGPAPSNASAATWTRRLGYLWPGLFPWRSPAEATTASGKRVATFAAATLGLVLVLDILLAVTHVWTAWRATFAIALVIGAIALLTVISRQPQNRGALACLAPGLPFLPAAAVTVNLYLILHLSPLTLVRFSVWMAIGLVVYFRFGISHSLLEISDGDVEGVAVTLSSPEHVKTLGPGDGFTTLDKLGGDVYGGKLAPVNDGYGGTNGGSDGGGFMRLPDKANPLFVSQSRFPTWDD